MIGPKKNLHLWAAQFIVSCILKALHICRNPLYFCWPFLQIANRKQIQILYLRKALHIALEFENFDHSSENIVICVTWVCCVNLLSTLLTFHYLSSVQQDYTMSGYQIIIDVNLFSNWEKMWIFFYCLF